MNIKSNSVDNLHLRKYNKSLLSQSKIFKLTNNNNNNQSFQIK